MDARRQGLRQYAQEFITGNRVEAAGPEYGYAILRFVQWIDEEFLAIRAALAQVRAEEEQAYVAMRAEAEQAVQRSLALRADLERLQDLYEASIEQQRETIERLVVENDDLRAKLYVQARRPAD